MKIHFTDKKAPHNAYASADGINKGIEKFNISKTYRDGYYNPNHFKFASSKEPNTLEQYSDSITAKEIDMTSAYPVTKTSFSYNESDGLYLAFQVHDTKRDGYFFTNGKGIHVTWKKTTDYEPTKYYDDDGNEIEVNTGKTMICVVKQGASFDVDGTSYKSSVKN